MLLCDVKGKVQVVEWVILGQLGVVEEVWTVTMDQRAEGQTVLVEQNFIKKTQPKRDVLFEDWNPFLLKSETRSQLFTNANFNHAYFGVKKIAWIRENKFLYSK